MRVSVHVTLRRLRQFPQRHLRELTRNPFTSNVRARVLIASEWN